MENFEQSRTSFFTDSTLSTPETIGQVLSDEYDAGKNTISNVFNNNYADIFVNSNIFNEILASNYIINLGLVEENLINDLYKAYINFLEKIGRIWGSPNALRFFENFSGNYQGIMRAIAKSFDTISENFNMVAKKDAEAKGATWTKKNIVHAITPNLVVSQYIFEKLPEGVGIKSDDIEPVLVEFRGKVDLALNEASSMLTDMATKTGLIGAKKVTAFADAGLEMKYSLMNAFNAFVERILQEVRVATQEEAIEDPTVVAIQSMAANIATAFASVYDGLGIK